MRKQSPILNFLAVACLATLSLGCATKQYVRDTVTPVDTRVTELDEKSTKNTEEISSLGEEVERDVSRLEERISGALSDAAKASDEAAGAQQSADEAGARAENAQRTAEDGIDRIQKTLADMSNYRQAAMEAVLFGFASSDLTDEAKGQLAVVAQAAGDSKAYVVEVRGFADSTGDAAYNLRLSERRAENVVRTLTAEHGVPLRSIHRLGLGEVSGENTSDARKQNRRVDVTLYLPVSDPSAGGSR